MEVCYDLSAWQYTALHCCHNRTEHSGPQAGYCLILLFDLFAVLFVLIIVVTVHIVVHTVTVSGKFIAIVVWERQPVV